MMAKKYANPMLLLKMFSNPDSSIPSAVPLHEPMPSPASDAALWVAKTTRIKTMYAAARVMMAIITGRFFAGVCHPFLKHKR